MPARSETFDALYAQNIDPWGFRTSTYERDKYVATLAALPRQRYASGIEVGCAIGELTRMLSFRCDRLIGIDVSAVALAEAERRTADRANITYVRADVPGEWPGGAFDLIVLSEILYFLSPAEIDILADRAADGTDFGGDCLLVNYDGPIEGGLQGAEAAEGFITGCQARGSWRINTVLSPQGYRMDLMTRAVG